MAPKYDYRCLKCGNTFTIEISYRDFNKTKKIISCPKCNANNCQRFISSPLDVHYKGSGFYNIDKDKNL
jgi:putative FmdB family regulatory protein